MLDPLTAFSLACGIIQVVDFGCKVASHSKELYERGSLAQNDDIEYLTESLQSLDTQILSDNDNSTTHAPLPPPPQQQQQQQKPEYQTALVDLAKKCSETANELLAELGQLKIDGDPRRSRWKTRVIKPIVAIRKQGKLEKLKSNLESFQQALNSRILSMLRQDVRSLVLEQKNLFDQIDERVRNLVTVFIERSSSSKEIAQILNQENQITRQYILDSFKRLEINDLEKKRQKDFLDTLHFPEIHRRQEQIKDAHEDTFKWIFDESGERIRPWSNFSQWLKYGSDTYWISGKPGSGKSTLMSFVLQDERTTDGLKVWAGSNKLLCPCFFFWAAGSPEQKTIVGLLRSLIYQMLKASPELLASSSIPESETVWTEKRLMRYMKEIIQRASMTHRICFFIDGLDEFSGDHELLRLILNLNNETEVKFCVASRPDKPYDSLKSASMLRLQDLTRSDIEKFVQAELGEIVQIKRLLPEDRYRQKKIVDNVVERADGVFLWVQLAVKTQVIGISTDDSFEMLEQRLLSLPGEIQDLYSNMLYRIDPFHRNEVAKYIKVILAQRYPYVQQRSGSPSIFDCTVATYCLTDDGDLRSSKLESRAVAQDCKYVYGRILAICAGFLQVEDYKGSEAASVGVQRWLAWEQDQSVKDSLSTNWVFKSVLFLHRTALDYFTDEGSDGGQFLIHNSSELSPEILMIASQLAKMRLCNLADPTRFMASMIYDCVGNSHTQLPSYALLRPSVAASFDRFVGRLDKKHNPTAEKSHWCTRWGPLSDVGCDTLPTLLSSEIENQEYVPNDLWTLAACYNCSDVVSTYLDQVGSVIEARQLTRLVICTMSQFSPRTDGSLVCSWEIETWEQITILHQLIQLGADLNSTLRASVWQMILKFVYSRSLLNEFPYGRALPSSRRKLLCDVSPTFLKTGIDVEPLINFTGLLEYSMEFSAELDTAQAPLFRLLLEEDGRTLELRQFDALRKQRAHDTPVRISFRVIGHGRESPEELVMTPEESHSIYEAINKTIYHAMGDDEEQWRESVEELQQVIESMAQNM